jgi:hypothetical protein
VWRLAYASILGSGHERRGQAGQDASVGRIVHRADDAELLVAGVADGAGSALRGGDGARIACATFIKRFARDRSECGAPPVESTDAWAAAVADWLGAFQAAIADQAEAARLAARDYACTFLGAILGDDRAALVQIGDGAMVLGVGDDSQPYRTFIWPQRGEYANETFFATDPAASRILVGDVLDRRVDEIAVLTDGLQGLVLDDARRVPHAPFFRRMFAVVRAAPPGHSPRLSDALAAYLASPAVRSRTDDDVTLLLATRRDVDAR